MRLGQGPGRGPRQGPRQGPGLGPDRGPGRTRCAPPSQSLEPATALAPEHVLGPAAELALVLVLVPELVFVLVAFAAGAVTRVAAEEPDSPEQGPGQTQSAPPSQRLEPAAGLALVLVLEPATELALVLVLAPVLVFVLVAFAAATVPRVAANALYAVAASTVI